MLWILFLLGLWRGSLNPNLGSTDQSAEGRVKVSQLLHHPRTVKPEAEVYKELTFF